MEKFIGVASGRFYRGVSALLFVVLAACSGVTHRATTIAQRGAIHAAHDADGATVARHLADRYYDDDYSCDGLPAVLCSGILLRVTKRGPGYYVWNPNPGSPTKNGVSFSWLREDSAFGRLAFGYANGFVILPYFFADSPGDGYTKLTVLCIFPFDADTTHRVGGNNDGCDANVNAVGTGPCQAQGILNASDWMMKFGTVANRYWEQCGFTLTSGTPNADDAFHAQGVIRDEVNLFSRQNEVMVGTWAQNDVHLPLEAFFFLDGDIGGLSEARQNQVDFQAQVGRWVPVIRLTLPTKSYGSATFEYITADQQIP